MDNAHSKIEYFNEQLLAEYSALRKEIDTLSKSRHQLMLFNLTILGAIVALSGKAISTFAMFSYPWISLIFAIGWSNYHFRMGEIGRYIKDNLETKAEGLNWESSFRRNAPRSWRMTERFALGVFCGSPFIVMAFMILDYMDVINNPSFPKIGLNLVSKAIPIVVCLLFFVIPCYLSYNNIGRRRRSEFINRWVSIATPIVNSKEWTSKEYINRVLQLAKDVNELDDPQLKESIIRSTYVTIVSSTKYSIKKASTLHISFYKMSDINKEKTQMAKWWYISIYNAFKQDSFIEWFKKKTFLKAVLYFPVDVCWEESPVNTVSEPKRIREFMKAIIAEEGECLWLGSYTSNEYKDNIEDQVRAKLLEYYPDKISHSMRVRSEYWAITPKLFYEVLQYYQTIKYKVNDPSLFALLYCIQHNKKVRCFDLGKYKPEDRESASKQPNKLERALELINDFRSNLCKI